MKTALSVLSCVAAISLAASANASVTVKITVPSKKSTTNSVLIASGTAKSTSPITNVYYSLNGGDWTSANGTTNWSSDELSLVAGGNTFSAYAVDANGTSSRTGKVTFTYVVKLPVTILTNGSGTVSPNYIGASLQIGNKYKIKPKPSKGWGFTGWSGSTNTTAQSLSFIMASNLTFTASFVDIQKPTCIVLTPAVNHTITSSSLTASGRASDNVGVTAINYQLNGGGWNPAVLDSNGTNWTASGLAPGGGANVLLVYASDDAGNNSRTNTVKFNYVAPPVTGPAPASLSGMAGVVTIDGDPGPFQITFSDATFAQGENTHDGAKVGNYTYTLLSSNMAKLVTTAMLPPESFGDTGDVFLTFTNDTTAVFTNSDGFDGFLTLAAASNFSLSASAITTAQYIDGGGDTNTLVLNGGSFTNDDGAGNISFGTYTLAAFSPVDLELIESFTDDVNTGTVSYVELNFTAASSGNYYVSSYDSLGNFLGTADGPMTVLNASNPPAGNAPTTIAGTQWTVTPEGKSSFKMCFGNGTLTGTGSDTNKNRVDDYVYQKTGADTALFSEFTLAPPSGDQTPQSGNLVYLTFSSATKASFISTNFDNGEESIETGSLSASSVSDIAPSSVAGKTANVTFSSHTDKVILNTDGTFSHTGSNGTDNSGSYTYTKYSPIGGLLVLSITDGSDAGNIAYVEMTFSSATSGDAFATSYDGSGNQQDAHGGSFSLK
jgi:hypothetical protein